MKTFSSYITEVGDYVTPSERAALIPYYTDGNGVTRIALMIPSDSRYGGSSPQIAKGGVEPGDSRILTAQKEGEEELGYIHKPGNRLKVLWINKQKTFSTTYYYVRVSDMKFKKPHFETKKVLWPKINDSLKIIRDIHREVIVRLIRKLKKIEKKKNI